LTENSAFEEQKKQQKPRFFIPGTQKDRKIAMNLKMRAFLLSLKLGWNISTFTI